MRSSPLSQNRQAPRRAVVESLEPRQLFSVGVILTSGGVAPVRRTALAPITAPTITPRGIPVTIHAEAGEPFHGTVGYLLGYFGPPTQLHANINWGDSTASTPGTVLFAGFGRYRVLGAHTFASAGTYKMDVIVTRQAGPPGSMTPVVLLADIKSTADVIPDTEGGVSLIETLNRPFVANLGTFDYSLATPVVGSTVVSPLLHATINWGDGQTTPGFVVHNWLADFDDWAVIGGHVYTQTGTYKVHVVVSTPDTNAALGTTVADFYSTVVVAVPPTAAG